METRRSGGAPPVEGSTQAMVEQILRAVQGIQYGAVEITVHDGRIVQIERKERLRFTGPAPKA